MIKGTIFDFNGTLYLDHDINKMAWEEAFYSVKPKDYNAKYSDLDRTNKPNDYLLSKAIYNHFNIEASDKEIEDLSTKKELRYIQLAKNYKRKELIKGAEDLFRYLNNHNVPYCIASMAPKMNFDFYLEYLNLDKWFSYKNIVYDNGRYNNKNSQLIDALKILGLKANECIIVEDSPENIQMACDKLKADKFIFVNTKKLQYNNKYILQEINNFSELDYNIFNN